MNFSWIIAAACIFVAAVTAQTTHTITIGKSGDAFDPPYISGYVNGDAVEFLIYHANPPYSVAESTFDQPCVASGDGLQFSVSPESTTPINDQQFGLELDPGQSLWFFVTNANRCAAGMVFAINPTTQQTYDAFKAKAMSSGTTSSASAGSSSSATSPNPSSGSSTKSSSASMKTFTLIQKTTAVMAGLVLLFA